ncbi:hypothetical protein OGAPHI_003788 [Ogataea philodendri]|uniref:Uncharacterized protein n=1 Tax=Ogataea philodendri TaxID=1378263 RepID=A0A9P8T507_9ASCO|nr:uncharacterized protein OGAPHI_003788 [Ogataea philodendri]KAH3665600.1 hypothetical protein OGAPHI_003788 [Ogataea philodendri]
MGCLRFAATLVRLADLGAVLNLAPVGTGGVEMLVGVVAMPSCEDCSNMFMSPSMSKLNSSLGNCGWNLSKENAWKRDFDVMDDWDGEYIGLEFGTELCPRKSLEASAVGMWERLGWWFKEVGTEVDTASNPTGDGDRFKSGPMAVGNELAPISSESEFINVCESLENWAPRIGDTSFRGKAGLCWLPMDLMCSI